jgi:hypothetical protein
MDKFSIPQLFLPCSGSEDTTLVVSALEERVGQQEDQLAAFQSARFPALQRFKADLAQKEVTLFVRRATPVLSCEMRWPIQGGRPSPEEIGSQPLSLSR